MQKSPKQEVTE